jgi:hypothetical protein
MRRESDDSYIAMQISTDTRCSFRWKSVEEGHVIVTPYTTVSDNWRDCPGKWSIEVNGNTYTVKKDDKGFGFFEVYLLSSRSDSAISA